MFGFLKPLGCDRGYRQVYAAYCAHQRRRFGILASPFVSYEAVFLYQLAIDAEICSAPASTTPTCCRLRNDWANHWQIDHNVADFCSAFAMLLVATKLDDDVQDSNSWTARTLKFALRAPLRRARHHLEYCQPGINAIVQDSIARHTKMEQQPAKNVGLKDYAIPTATAFGSIFEAFARYFGSDTPTVARFRKLGESIGSAILLSDCLFDLAKDRARGHFNPLNNSGKVKEARQLTLRFLSQAGWLCATSNSTTPTAIGAIIRAFERVRHYQPPLDHFQVKRNSPAVPWLRYAKRRGDCDCDCGGCCDIGCGGDEGCFDDNACCFADGFGCMSSPPVVCCDPCYPCFEPKKKESEKQESLDQIAHPLVGLRGVTVGPLNPSGIVLIDGTEHPAKSDQKLIESGCDIVVIRAEAFGLIVEEVELD